MLSIRHRLLILQCVTVLATTLFLGALSYSLFIPAIFRLQQREQQYVSQEAAQEIDSYLQELSKTLESLDLEEFHNRYGDLPLEELFVRHFSTLSGRFPLLSYLDEKGNETVRLSNSRPSEYFFDHSNNRIVQEAVAHPNRVQIMVSRRSPGFDQPALQLAITKVGYFGDQFLGTLLVTIPLSDLKAHLKSVIPQFDDGFVSIVDRQQVLLDSRSGVLFKPLQRPLPEQPARHSLQGEDMFVASARVESTGWQVVAARPYAAFTRELARLKLLAGLTGLLVTLLSAGLAIRLVRHLTRNIELLIEHAEKVGAGDYDHYLELYQDPDFEKLGEAINTMTRDIARARNTSESLQQILQSIIDPLVVADQQGNISRINHATLELLGCEENQLLGKPLAELFPNPPQLLTEASFASALMRKRVSNLETQVSGANNQRITVLFSSSPAPGRNIDMGVVGIMKNIDELVNARIAREHALREAEEAHRRIDALLRSVADGLIVTDLSGRVLLHNQPAEDLLGDPKNPAFKEVLGNLPATVQNGSLAPFDITLPAAGETPHRILQVHSSPVLDHRGSQTGIVSVLRDVTRERALEQIKTEFISTAAHELTTPLTSILGYSELLLDRELEDRFSNDQKRDFMEEIFNRSAALSKIVDDLLNISRIESGQPIPLDIQPVDLQPQLRKIVDNFRYFSAEHRIEIELDPNGARPTLVDSDRIGQVMENLLSNAVKYSAAGSSILVRSSFAGNRHRIEVSDQGIGMNEQQLERIFDKFYRCDSSNTAIGGLGLGMSIVRQIVEGHRGSIEVASEPNQGTTVTLHLPLAE